MTMPGSLMILMAEDDADDRLLVREAWEESRLANELRFVEDGEELMDYLHHSGRHADPASSPRPDLVLLDLNMPRKGGRECLEEIKKDPGLKDIPVVILTSSKEEEDVVRSYDLGVNSYIMKPVTFERMLEIVTGLDRYWFQIVELPASTEQRRRSAAGRQSERRRA
jgi:two-component system, response regulator